MSVRSIARIAFASAVGIAFAIATRAAANANVAETFNSTAVANANWSTGGSACLTAATTTTPGTGGIKTCGSGTGLGGATGTLPDANGSGALRLTGNAANQSGYAIYGTAQSASAGVQVTFTEYSYDTPTLLGTGLLANSGDGLSFFLVNAASGVVPSAAGPFGAGLGYASGAAGIANGFLGVGFDEYGGFTSPRTPQSVGIRGNAASSYGQIASQALNLLGLLGSRIDTPTATTRGAAVPITWRITLAANKTIEVDANFNGGGYQTIVAPTSITGVNGSTIPNNYYIGVAASTDGNGQEFHEITNLNVATLGGSYSMTNGPVGAPAAIGSYDGASAVNANDDFTERSFMQPGLTAVYNATTPSASTTFSAPTAGISVPNQIANTGTIVDTYSLVATAPAGWQVQLFADNGLGTPGTGTGLNGPSTTPLTGSTAGATTTGQLTLAASASAAYWAVLSAPSGIVSYARFDAPIVATSTSVGTVTNATHDELYSGFVYATKTLSVPATNCPAGQSVPASGVCPGGTLAYRIAYGNVALGGGTGNTEPASALLSTRAGTFSITEDGNAQTNNWGSLTNGLSGAPVDSTSGSTFVYGGSLTVAGSTSFVDTVGGATGSLAPGATGNVTFSVTVK